MIKQARLKRVRCEPIYKFGVQVPRDSREARYLEKKESHTHWAGTERVEINQSFSYNILKT